MTTEIESYNINAALTIIKNGKSLCVIIPKIYIDELNLKANDKIYISIKKKE